MDAQILEEVRTLTKEIEQRYTDCQRVLNCLAALGMELHHGSESGHNAAELIADHLSEVREYLDDDAKTFLDLFE